jgi:hypothetical protein
MTLQDLLQVLEPTTWVKAVFECYGEDVFVRHMALEFLDIHKDRHPELLNRKVKHIDKVDMNCFTVYLADEEQKKPRTVSLRDCELADICPCGVDNLCDGKSNRNWNNCVLKILGTKCCCVESKVGEN